MAKKATVVETNIKIPAVNFGYLAFDIEGITPLVMHKFSQKAQAQIKAKHEKGSTAGAGTKRAKRDFEADCKAATHFSTDGWIGIPCSAFRNAAVSACRTTGFAMTRAKLAVFCEPDGYEDDGTPLVKITKGKPKTNIAPARNDKGGIDLRSRPMWAPGWQARVEFRFDLDMFEAQDVANLMQRIGLQVGILEGRPDSKKGAGCGWGTFKIINKKEVTK